MRVFTFIISSLLFTFLLLPTSTEQTQLFDYGRRAGIPRGGGGEDLGEISSEKALDKMLSQLPFEYGWWWRSGRDIFRKSIR
ncbi:hypothetical protein MANES_04G066380v8 [Manihot esculenta]|uniref:Uncharacterized protein n=1 Tax=Manihot esculenta TaxID=3983 RepID=A0ACB7HY80_MANES|nr:hypothetical protein MANES_04G066380v8 [Manihot esculenta]